MDQLCWTTRWEVWRDLMDAPSSRQRKRVMEFLQTRPALLYWGDSWFSTPLYLNLARQSLLRIDGMAMLMGKPGATASELFTAAHIHNITARVLGSPFDIVCISAGGNDQLSERLESVFAAWMPPRHPAKIDAQEAFEVLSTSRTFDVIRDRYVALLSALRPVQRKRPHFRVVGHTYAPIQRIGAKGDLTIQNIGLVAWLKGDVGPWLWKPMQRVLPNLAEGKAFADLLLQQGFRDRVLKPLAAPAMFGDIFSYADFSNAPGITDPSFWYDEIHPKEAGFAQLAGLLNQHIRSVVPLQKQQAIS